VSDTSIAGPVESLKDLLVEDVTGPVDCIEFLKVSDSSIAGLFESLKDLLVEEVSGPGLPPLIFESVRILVLQDLLKIFVDQLVSVDLLKV